MARIGGIVLAAGLSRRMGTNKLLTKVRGKPMVRLAAEAALGSDAGPVIVVTGNEHEGVEAVLCDLHLETVNNPDFARGLSTSLKRGLNALPEDCDGAVVMLADMPDVGSALVDKLIAAFDPSEGRAICIPTWNGQRGNPVVWAKRFFPEMLAIEGDMGARQLIGQYEELVCEVEVEDDAPLTDLDTPEALRAYEGR
jgi:molybdenum cofactor cytidylyltransferase